MRTSRSRASQARGSGGIPAALLATLRRLSSDLVSDEPADPSPKASGPAPDKPSDRASVVRFDPSEEVCQDVHGTSDAQSSGRVLQQATYGKVKENENQSTSASSRHVEQKEDADVFSDSSKDDEPVDPMAIANCMKDLDVAVENLKNYELPEDIKDIMDSIVSRSGNWSRLAEAAGSCLDNLEGLSEMLGSHISHSNSMSEGLLAWTQQIMALQGSLEEKLQTANRNPRSAPRWVPVVEHCLYKLGVLSDTVDLWKDQQFPDDGDDSSDLQKKSKSDDNNAANRNDGVPRTKIERYINVGRGAMPTNGGADLAEDSDGDSEIFVAPKRKVKNQTDDDPTAGQQEGADIELDPADQKPLDNEALEGELCLEEKENSRPSSAEEIASFGEDIGDPELIWRARRSKHTDRLMRGSDGQGVRAGPRQGSAEFRWYSESAGRQKADGQQIFPSAPHDGNAQDCELEELEEFGEGGNAVGRRRSSGARRSSACKVDCRRNSDTKPGFSDEGGEQRRLSARAAAKAAKAETGAAALAPPAPLASRRPTVLLDLESAAPESPTALVAGEKRRSSVLFSVQEQWDVPTSPTGLSQWTERHGQIRQARKKACLIGRSSSGTLQAPAEPLDILGSKVNDVVASPRYSTASQLLETVSEDEDRLPATPSKGSGWSTTAASPTSATSPRLMTSMRSPRERRTGKLHKALFKVNANVDACSQLPEALVPGSNQLPRLNENADVSSQVLEARLPSPKSRDSTHRTLFSHQRRGRRNPSYLDKEAKPPSASETINSKFPAIDGLTSTESKLRAIILQEENESSTLDLLGLLADSVDEPVPQMPQISPRQPVSKPGQTSQRNGRFSTLPALVRK